MVFKLQIFSAYGNLTAEYLSGPIYLCPHHKIVSLEFTPTILLGHLTWITIIT